MTTTPTLFSRTRHTMLRPHTTRCNTMGDAHISEVASTCGAGTVVLQRARRCRSQSHGSSASSPHATRCCGVGSRSRHTQRPRRSSAALIVVMDGRSLTVAVVWRPAPEEGSVALVEPHDRNSWCGLLAAGEALEFCGRADTERLSHRVLTTSVLGSWVATGQAVLQLVAIIVVGSHTSPAWVDRHHMCVACFVLAA